MTDRELQTAAQVHATIGELFDERALGANNSEYDRAVCIRAVEAARNAYKSVPIRGSSVEYRRVVVAVLIRLRTGYNDLDGQYTSGKGSIGDALDDIGGLLLLSEVDATPLGSGHG